MVIVRCSLCEAYFDDAFRVTYCPHNTFLANDGNNNYAHHPNSYLSKTSPIMSKLVSEVLTTDGRSYQEALKFAEKEVEVVYGIPENANPDILGYTPRKVDPEE